MSTDKVKSNMDSEFICVLYTVNIDFLGEINEIFDYDYKFKDIINSFITYIIYK